MPAKKDKEKEKKEAAAVEPKEEKNTPEAAAEETGDQTATATATADEQPAEATQPPEEEKVPQEIKALDAALEQVFARLQANNEKIQAKEEEIVGLRRENEELEKIVQKRFGPLLTKAMPKERKPGRKFRGGTPSRAASTGKLIVDCLKRATQPTDTDTIKDYLSRHGNNTNPSVELSRMVKRGIVERSGRGLYTLKAEA